MFAIAAAFTIAATTPFVFSLPFALSQDLGGYTCAAHFFDMRLLRPDFLL